MNAFKCFILLLSYTAVQTSLGMGLLLSPRSSSIQKSSQTQLEEMRKLDFLVGEWRGDGWQLTKEGERGTTFSQRTKVEVKEKNAKLRIQDRKSYKQGQGMLFHSSTLDASISYDEKTKLYHWHGQYSKSVIEAKLVAERTLQYGMPFSVTLEPEQGNRKTTIRVTQAGQWEETLEVWERGKWYIVEQAILTKVK